VATPLHGVRSSVAPGRRGERRLPVCVGGWIVAVVPLLPEQTPGGDARALIAALVLAGALVVAYFWLLSRRLMPAAWVGRVDDRGPAVWRVTARLRAPERVRRRVSWGSDETYVDELAEAVLRRVNRHAPTALVRRFADEVLGGLPDDGFVLHEHTVRDWLNIRGGAAEPSAREVIG